MSKVFIGYEHRGGKSMCFQQILEDSEGQDTLREGDITNSYGRPE